MWGTTSTIKSSLSVSCYEPMLDDWTGPHGGYPPFDKVTVAGMSLRS